MRAISSIIMSALRFRRSSKIVAPPLYLQQIGIIKHIRLMCSGPSKEEIGESRSIANNFKELSVKHTTANTATSLCTSQSNRSGEGPLTKPCTGLRHMSTQRLEAQESGKYEINSLGDNVKQGSDKMEKVETAFNDRMSLKGELYAGGGIVKLQNMKKSSKAISMVASYDYWSAKIINETNVDVILVGDSLAMVMHGYENTTSATVDLMCTHVSAVARGATEKFIIADMPFLSCRKGLRTCMNSVQRMILCGAHAVKIEGAKGNFKLISHIVESGIPVMGHIGLMPQFINQSSGFKVQGKGEEKEKELLELAFALEQSGCFALLVECIPDQLGKKITDSLQIPTIGIGAGRHVSGQVLVLHDMLGMNSGFKPKFLKTFLDDHKLIKNALNDYDKDVKTKQFPLENHCY